MISAKMTAPGHWLTRTQQVIQAHNLNYFSEGEFIVLKDFQPYSLGLTIYPKGGKPVKCGGNRKAILIELSKNLRFLSFMYGGLTDYEYNHHSFKDFDTPRFYTEHYVADGTVLIPLISNYFGDIVNEFMLY